MIYHRSTKAHLLTQFMRLRSRVLTCLVSSIKRSQAPLQVPEPTCPSGIHPQRSSWVGWEGGMRTTGTLNSLNNIYNKQQEIGAFFWHLLAGNELSFEPSRHVAPLQPPPWNFGTAEWNHEQLKQLSRPPQGPLQIGLSCLSQLHAGALVPIDLFSHLSTCRRHVIA